MKSTAKFAGRKMEWPEAGPALMSAWNFETRPGGWVIATRSVNGKAVERKRFSYMRSKQQFFAKFTSGNSVDFFGERIAAVRAGAGSDASSDYTAQFPGKVRKILVAEGAQVAAGTPLLMVEAMKMEFAIKAGTSGTVRKILVEEGVTLTPGQKLLDFEELQAPK